MKILGCILFLSIGYTIGVMATLVILTLIMAGIVGALVALELLDIGKPPAVQALCRACGQPVPAGRIVQGRVVRKSKPSLAYAY